jgi:hypothetical protein
MLATFKTPLATRSRRLPIASLFLLCQASAFLSRVAISLSGACGNHLCRV